MVIPENPVKITGIIIAYRNRYIGYGKSGIKQKKRCLIQPFNLNEFLKSPAGKTFYCSAQPVNIVV